MQCAHSVIELITEFWPYAIDILSREKGVVDGSKPVFFSGWDSDTVRYVSHWLDLFLFYIYRLGTGTISLWRVVSINYKISEYSIDLYCNRGSPIEFGAQQC